MSKSARRFAIGTLIAAAAGYAVGVLTAPKSGKETRADVKKAADKAFGEAERALKKTHSEISELVEKAERRLKTAQGKAKKELGKKLKSAQNTKQKIREILSAVHDGDADDKQLKAAVKDAKTARDHLKAFLKT